MMASARPTSHGQVPPHVPSAMRAPLVRDMAKRRESRPSGDPVAPPAPSSEPDEGSAATATTRGLVATLAALIGGAILVYAVMIAPAPDPPSEQRSALREAATAVAREAQATVVAARKDVTERTAVAPKLVNSSAMGVARSPSPSPSPVSTGPGAGASGTEVVIDPPRTVSRPSLGYEYVLRRWYGDSGRP